MPLHTCQQYNASLTSTLSLICLSFILLLLCSCTFMCVTVVTAFVNESRVVCRQKYRKTFIGVRPAAFYLLNVNCWYLTALEAERQHSQEAPPMSMQI